MNKLIIIQLSSDASNQHLCLGSIAPQEMPADYDQNFAFDIAIPCAIKQSILPHTQREFLNLSINTHNISLPSMGLVINFAIYHIYTKTHPETIKAFREITLINSNLNIEFIKKIEHLTELPTFSLNNILPHGFESFIDPSNKNQLLNENQMPDIKKFFAHVQSNFFNTQIPIKNNIVQKKQNHL